MNPTISILTGSGFSIPEGLPGVRKLNETLSNINESDILIHSSGRALFLNGGTDRQFERHFVQEFIEFYVRVLNEKGKEFNYEEFYDFYSGYLFGFDLSNQSIIDNFCDEFNSKYNLKDNSDYYDNNHRLSSFNDTFNQLLGSLLQKAKYYEDIAFENGTIYDTLLNFISNGIENIDFKFHTLNHDLIIDWIGKHHNRIFMHYCDGFQMEGSPFLGSFSTTLNGIRKEYKVRLEYYSGNFTNKFAYFKLHGSLTNRVVYINQPMHTRSRLKDDYAIGSFYMEITDGDKNRIIPILENVFPDFLSGTTNKIRYYHGDPYYKELFEHFSKNLQISSYLIVIGYGFQDEGINDYLIKNYLSQGKSMLIIDPGAPVANILEEYKANITQIKKGIDQLEFSEIVNNLPEDLKKFYSK